MLIAVVNETNNTVSNADLSTMCAAIQVQLDLHFAPAWNQKSIPIKFYSNPSQVPGYAWLIHIINNDAQVQGALGFHQQEASSGKIDGYIMCDPILSNGGKVLAFDPSNPAVYTVSGTLSHEVLETFMDRFTNSWYDRGDGTLICAEVCDPCEEIGYGILVNGVNVAVSDFIFPSWANQYATLSKNAPFNYLNTLKAPFSMLSGGYQIQRSGGNESQVFGENMPQWRKEAKMKSFSRSIRRISQ